MGSPSSMRCVEQTTTRIAGVHKKLYKKITNRYTIRLFKSVVKKEKGKSALMMFDKHANLKYKFGNRHFWAE